MKRRLIMPIITTSVLSIPLIISVFNSFWEPQMLLVALVFLLFLIISIISIITAKRAKEEYTNKHFIIQLITNISTLVINILCFPFIGLTYSAEWLILSFSVTILSFIIIFILCKPVKVAVSIVLSNLALYIMLSFNALLIFLLISFS